jgi:thermostable 8-oxoguanine DNA glycosylase
LSSSPVVSPASWPNVRAVEAFFVSITDEEIRRYRDYWRTLTPEDYFETFERWLFAFCSVHTTWTSNVRGFQAIREWTRWYQDKDMLLTLLKDSGVGLHSNRTRFISQFANDYWNNPQVYYYTPAETWVAYRNRLVNRILGLGLAKVSFALEMIYPCAAEIVCLDTHMFQFYGLDQSKHARHYQALERHWVSHSLGRNVPSTVARAIYWDRKQKRTDSRYWTHILERPIDGIQDTKILAEGLVTA